jgi:hypothetical protein
MNKDMIRTSAGNIPALNDNHQTFQLCWKIFKTYGYLAGFGGANNEERDPNHPEPHTTPLEMDRELGRSNKMKLPSLASWWPL